MAKSNYLPGILFIGALLVFGGAGGFSVENQEENQVSGIKNQDGSSLIENRRGFSEDLSAYSLKKALVKQIYDSQIGVREQGTNGGPQVEKYLKYVGLSKGQPWCAAFVCWVYGQAGVGNPKTGWSPALFPASKVIWERAESGKLLRPPKHSEGGTNINRFAEEPAAQTLSQLITHNSQPVSGDIFGLYFPEKKRIAHVGFIDEWKDPWLITVEGNTNESGAREGDGVYRKRRPVRSIYRVARYIN